MYLVGQMSDVPEPSIYVIVSDLRLTRATFDVLVSEASRRARPVHQLIQEILAEWTLHRGTR